MIILVVDYFESEWAGRKHARKIVLLDRVSQIEFCEETGNLIFWNGQDRTTIHLGKQDGRGVVNAILRSFAPLYEARSGQTHGIRIDLDLCGLTVDAQ